MHKREDGFVVVDEDVCMAAATAIWLARMAHRNITKRRPYDQMRWLL